MMNRPVEINILCGAANVFLVNSLGEALPDKLEVFKSLQPAVTHSGHSGSVLGPAVCCLSRILGVSQRQ